MAQVLKKFEFSKSSPAGSFPWTEWMDGRVWKIEQGTDFTSDMGTMRSHLYAIARYHGKKCRTSVEGQTALVFQFYEVNGHD